ncbi:unnamed protein product [Cyclocybe aegerita]|uniref:Uncharacterized protein n=1 Tax=Cyclocybe aegerita TaxID=1973307 RepID=A0A8S0VUA3_CYCAE|nr:unnamed protein product [Cyclocybe aegerita]
MIHVQKKPIGGFRGGIVAFLFGFSLASSFAAYHLEEYQQASTARQASVEELKISQRRCAIPRFWRIEAVEKDLNALSDSRTIPPGFALRLKSSMTDFMSNFWTYVHTYGEFNKIFKRTPKRTPQKYAFDYRHLIEVLLSLALLAVNVVVPLSQVVLSNKALTHSFNSPARDLIDTALQSSALLFLAGCHTDIAHPLLRSVLS